MMTDLSVYSFFGHPHTHSAGMSLIISILMLGTVSEMLNTSSIFTWLITQEDLNHMQLS
jgi:hypothetical protein